VPLLVRERPTGPLFLYRLRKPRTQKYASYAPWTKQRAVDVCWKLRKRAGVPHLIPYSFRHTFAVRWLRERKPIAALAEILGTSIQQIVDHYSHLAKQTDYLRSLVDDFDR